jgi:YegS/Rv2252/BmrU family lipid kinase
VRRLALIVNPAAAGGRTSRCLAAVRAALSTLGLEHRVEWTRSLEHAGELARQATAAGETAVPFGGDGVVRAVAAALKRSGEVIGILPGGRGNDFARVLGIPLEPVKACEVLASGTPRELDLGQVGAQTFIGIASCGFDSVANRIANETRLVHGNLVYAYGALRALANWRPATFTIKVDGDEARLVTGYTVAAANNKYYGGGMMLAPNATLQDGLLDIVLVADTSKLRFLRALPTVFRGQHVAEPNVQVLRGSQLEISSSRPFTLYADGDPIADLPATVSVIPHAVQTLVPA